MYEQNKNPSQSSRLEMGIYADTTWCQEWKEQGFNCCISTAIDALRYLSEHERPSGGEQHFNFEHLVDTSRYLEKLTKDAEAYYTTGKPYPQPVRQWPEQWLKAGLELCLPVAAEALEFLARHGRPEESGTGEPVQFSASHLRRIAHGLEVTRERMFGYQAPAPKTPQGARISAANLPDEFVIKDPAKYAEDFESRARERLAGGGFVPGTLGGFIGGYIALYRRHPTEQEIFDAGVRAGQARERAAT
jgi:hypothetical protein